ncbi:MAG: hypothetical protein AB7K37_11580 [Cyclobacteriaceae bacterium]
MKSRRVFPSILMDDTSYQKRATVISQLKTSHDKINDKTSGLDNLSRMLRKISLKFAMDLIFNFVDL